MTLYRKYTGPLTFEKFCQRTFGVDTKGNLCYAMSTHPDIEKEWIEIGNVRQIKLAKATNKINFPLQLTIETAKISMFVGLERSSERETFVKMLREAQNNVLCQLELRNLGLQKIPMEVVRMSELTALDISNNQIKNLPRMHMPLLETFVLDRNGFSAVPRTIYEDLTCISRLSLIDNPIARLPTNLGDMPMMRNLQMNVNFQLESPPAHILKSTLDSDFI